MAWRRVFQQQTILMMGLSKTKKNTFFQKRTGEVIENKEKDYMNSLKPKRKADNLLKTGSFVKAEWDRPKTKRPCC